MTAREEELDSELPALIAGGRLSAGDAGVNTNGDTGGRRSVVLP
ncbi:MAG: hypothetical protein PHZ00_00765 [Candidatus Peribacteraceae bacterium]|nr:hypothetical protein [Candidatus Peribacteraceae bacterium]